MKKAQAMQFNWIFVIIAGFIILAFFIMFTVKYIDLQNKKMAAKVANGIDTSLDALKTAEQLSTLIPLTAPTTINFNCKNFEVNNYFSKSISGRMIFSSNIIKTKELEVWLQPWKFPFKVDSFFYLSGQEIKYFILYNSVDIELISQLREDIPEMFSLSYVTNINEIKGDPLKYQEIRVIVINQDTSQIKNLNIKNLKVIGINANTQKIKIDNKEIPYFDLPLLYGAIFSDSYECMFEKSLDKLQEISKLYAIKTLYLWRYDTKNCNYGLIKQNFDSFINAIKTRNYGAIEESANLIEMQNKDLNSKNCITIY